VFCMPSTLRAEAFGVAAVEAMARGLAVVSTRIPGSGLAWLQQDGVTGLQVPPGDPLALAAALRRLLDDGALRARFGAAGRARWAALFTAETMADQTVALYRRLLTTRPKP
jgi:glycosyltransferase involved in cell wall biosynthesis